jgi:phospholipid/cholesterol/gamma-HCH transport system permease protein
MSDPHPLPRAPAETAHAWTVRAHPDGMTVALSGDWVARRTGLAADAVAQILARATRGTIGFDTAALGAWDSALIAFLWTLRTAAEGQGLHLDESGLPTPARRLLALAVAGAAEPVPLPPPRPSLLVRTGARVLEIWAEGIAVLTMIGEAVLRTPPAWRGRGGMRGVDLLTCAREAGADALVIVSVVNLLVGGILAFVGAVQLKRFGAGIYVANLIAIAVAREMAALITAIVMSGRTGGAYAAHVATMQGNEEIDALRVVGIPVFDYLILPRLTALTLMMPLLYLYATALGIIGGFIVAVALLDITPVGFVLQARGSMGLDQVVFGLIKSVVFGGVIALTGCHVGLKAGRSAADVGRAATTAVVSGIVAVIAIDAVFAVCANALGF